MSDEDLRRSARLALEARLQGADGDEDDDDGAASARHSHTRPSIADDVRQRNRAARKRKADRMFDREIGDGSPAAEAGPRAAVYRGKMGRTHRRSARIQNERAGTETSLRGRVAMRLMTGRRPAFVLPVLVLACVIGIGAFLYYPAQQCYIAVRDEAKAQAQLDALQQKNDELQQRVDELSTDAGVEDEARSDYGWVMDGETAVHVSGLSSDGDAQADDPSADSAANVTAPDTWYSGVLDTVFGYDKG